jgi:hypothetical protein
MKNIKILLLFSLNNTFNSMENNETLDSLNSSKEDTNLSKETNKKDKEKSKIPCNNCTSCMSPINIPNEDNFMTPTSVNINN